MNTLSPRVAQLLQKMEANKGRLAFLIDATGSRSATWDLATGLTASMFEEAAKLGGLDMQLSYYRGDGLRASEWTSDAPGLIRQMRRVHCEAGPTQIARILRYLRRQHELKKINAAIFIGDACEEIPGAIYDAANNLPPLFVFQEGNGTVAYLDQYGDPLAYEGPPQSVEKVFRELARISGGAYGRFDAGAAKLLGELLRAVVAFACGGISALAGQHTESARLLLGQMK